MPKGKRIDQQALIGTKHGKLTILGIAGRDSGGNLQVRALCDCGTELPSVRWNSIKRGSSTSCGCAQKELTRQLHTTHGMGRTSLYKVWANMIQRTTNPKSQFYYRYGGRGIHASKEWRKSFESFAEWALKNGYRPGLELDRINNDLGYYPQNCRWVSHQENTANRGNSRLVTYPPELTGVKGKTVVLK